MFKIYSRLNMTIKRRIFKLLNKNKFKFYGKNSIIISPLKIDGIENISIGNNVQISYKSWIAAMKLTGNECELIIKNGTTIGNFNHIYATNSIIIEENVITADKVYISDNSHEYSDIYKPISRQPIKQLNKVIIGSGSWLGENVCVIGASIGQNCVIGSNSVVTRDIPDYCVAVGSPAKIIKKYNHKTQKWEIVK